MIDVPGLDRAGAELHGPERSGRRSRVTNAPRSGPVGAITYLIEVADSDSFANKVATWTAAETPNQTALTSPVDLAYGKVYYWHVRAYDPTTLGPWSPTQAFQMLAEPAPVYTPPPSAPSGPAPNDAINLNTVIIHNSPADVASWPVTTTLSRLDLMPSGAHVGVQRAELVAGGRAAGLVGRAAVHAVDRAEHQRAVARVRLHRVLARPLRERRPGESVRDELVLRSDPLGRR